LIFLPEGFRRRLTTLELRHILAHETAHLRHGDSVLNCLLIPLCALHWFNPMVWLCRRILLAERELLRDQQAIRALSPSQEGDGYGHTLLKVTLLNQTSAPAPGLTAFFNSEKEIQRRIAMITHPAPSPRPILKIAALCTIPLVVLGSFTVAPAQKPAEPAGLPPAIAKSEPLETSVESIGKVLADLREAIPKAKTAVKELKAQELKAQKMAADFIKAPSSPDLEATAPLETAEPMILRPVPGAPPSPVPSNSPVPGAIPVDPTFQPPASGNPQALPVPSAPEAPVGSEELPTPAATPQALQEERPEEIVDWRQEVLRLRQELAEVRQMNQAAGKPADVFEQALATAELKKVKADASGLGGQHPAVQQMEEEIKQLREIIAVRQAREFDVQKFKMVEAEKTQMKVKAERDGLIRRLIAYKSEIAVITTELESIPLNDQKPEWRATRFERLGQMRSQIEELEIRLKYDFLD